MTEAPDNSIFEQALALYHAGRLGEAAHLCRGVAAAQPDHWRALHLLGAIALRRGHPDMSLRFLQAAAGRGSAPVRASLAAAYRALGRLEDARTELDAAILEAPEIAEYRFNLGNLLQDLDEPEAAEAAYRTALSLDPELAAAHWNLGLLLLRDGRLAEAWPEYEWRWRRPGTPLHYRRHPTWQGEDFSGRTLLLYTEQGFGDALQFARWLPLVAARGGRVVLECPRELLRLFASSFPQVALLPKGEPPPPFDLQASLPSLPGIFRVTLETIPANIPYLKVPPGSGSTLPPMGDGLTVGLAWACSPASASAARSIGLARLAPLFAVPKVRFYGLQVGPAAAELVEGRWPVTDLSPCLSDFADTAAAVARLDLVISVDTAVVHVAGALGRPVWVALPHPADWRWLRQRGDSPWYPSATLFRQAPGGGWPAVAEALAQHLAALVDKMHHEGHEDGLEAVMPGR